MYIRYRNLLSPIQVGNVLLKNRMTSTPALPHFIQGTEPFPTEKWITHLANRAKNGAAAVNINHFESASPQSAPIGFTPAHFSIMDKDSTSCHNYVCQMIDAIRYYGAVAVSEPIGYYTRDDGSADGGPSPAPGTDDPGMGGPDGTGGPAKPIDEAHLGTSWRKFRLGYNKRDTEHSHPQIMTKAQIQEYIDNIVKDAVWLKTLGFEMLNPQNVCLGGPGAQFWSPITNFRTDEYGGSVQNRARFIVEVFDALKQTLGRDFPLECYVSGTEEGGVTVEDNIELARLLVGKADILHIRNGDMDVQHPLGFTSTPEMPCPNLDMAAAIKRGIVAKGIDMKVAVSAGLQDADLCESIIKNGQADLIASARTWIADPEYGKKLYEGRGEDIRPCIRCNKCHVPNDSDKFRSFCSVNPTIGIEDKIERMVTTPNKVKNVAVIGGGPAGMEAALVCAERGHKVTLYEKSSILGGQLLHADYASFKWPLKNFKDYLVRQMYKHDVTVMLNTEATADILDAQNYDAAVIAIGPVFKVPSIPGIENAYYVHANDVFGHLELVRGKVAVIGGAETGVETAMYLADNGYDVTVMTRQTKLASDAPHAHYIDILEDAYLSRKSLHYVTLLKKYTKIDELGVHYIDYQGNEAVVEAETIVLATGTGDNGAAAAKLYGAAAQTYYIGDCIRPGDVHKAVSAGFAAASQI